VRRRLLPPALGGRLEVEAPPLDARAVAVAGGVERLGQAEAHLGHAPALRIGVEIRAVFAGGVAGPGEQPIAFAADEARFAVERAFLRHQLGVLERILGPRRL
jgi:hypothetical protein